ncbi:hypothetical protein DIPPA_62410 [Diplonema papillatum]|nr:hypothetical protein DIPPA_62410 [Diplonema papillatum]
MGKAALEWRVKLLEAQMQQIKEDLLNDDTAEDSNLKPKPKPKPKLKSKKKARSSGQHGTGPFHLGTSIHHARHHAIPSGDKENSHISNNAGQTRRTSGVATRHSERPSDVFVGVANAGGGGVGRESDMTPSARGGVEQQTEQAPTEQQLFADTPTADDVMRGWNQSPVRPVRVACRSAGVRVYSEVAMKPFRSTPSPSPLSSPGRRELSPASRSRMSRGTSAMPRRTPSPVSPLWTRIHALPADVYVRSNSYTGQPISPRRHATRSVPSPYPIHYSNVSSNVYPDAAVVPVTEDDGTPRGVVRIPGAVFARQSTWSGDGRDCVHRSVAGTPQVAGLSPQHRANRISNGCSDEVPNPSSERAVSRPLVWHAPASTSPHVVRVTAQSIYREASDVTLNKDEPPAPPLYSPSQARTTPPSMIRTPVNCGFPPPVLGGDSSERTTDSENNASSLNLTNAPKHTVAWTNSPGGGGGVYLVASTATRVRNARDRDINSNHRRQHGHGQHGEDVALRDAESPTLVNAAFAGEAPQSEVSLMLSPRSDQPSIPNLKPPTAANAVVEPAGSREVQNMQSSSSHLTVSSIGEGTSDSASSEDTKDAARRTKRESSDKHGKRGKRRKGEKGKGSRRRPRNSEPRTQDDKRERKTKRKERKERRGQRRHDDTASLDASTLTAPLEHPQPEDPKGNSKESPSTRSLNGCMAPSEVAYKRPPPLRGNETQASVDYGSQSSVHAHEMPSRSHSAGAAHRPVRIDVPVGGSSSPRSWSQRSSTNSPVVAASVLNARDSIVSSSSLPEARSSRHPRAGLQQDEAPTFIKWPPGFSDPSRDSPVSHRPSFGTIKSLPASPLTVTGRKTPPQFVVKSPVSSLASAHSPFVSQRSASRAGSRGPLPLPPSLPSSTLTLSPVARYQLYGTPRSPSPRDSLRIKSPTRRDYLPIKTPSPHDLLPGRSETHSTSY